MSIDVLAGRIASSHEIEDRSSARDDFPTYAKSRISIPVLCGLVGAADVLIILSVGIAAAEFAGMLAINRQVAGLIGGLGTILTINILHLSGAYDLNSMRRLKASLGIVAFGLFISFVILAVLAALAQVPPEALAGWLPLWFGGSLGFLAAGRIGLRQRIGQWRRAGRLGENVAIIGANDITHRLLFSLTATQERRCQIVGIFDDRKTRVPARCCGHRVMGGIDDLIWEIRAGYVDAVLISLPLSADRRIMEILDRLSRVAVDVRICPDQFGLQLGRFKVSHFGDSAVIDILDRPLCHWRQVAKSVEDRALAFLILLLISPVLLAIAIAIKLDSPGPVLFRQNRWGYNNQLFQMLKFRTMHHAMSDPDAKRLVTQDDKRVTRLGRFLRRTSLDELPQFINVLKGEMSIVGPRPHALAARAGDLLYQDAVRQYDARHRIKPGITGWAQVNGWRGETRTVEQIAKRVEHDLHYIENWSIFMDLRIILKTVLCGFTGPAAY